MTDFSRLFGILAGILGFLAFIPYIRSILRGETKPNRATTGIWTAVSTVLLLSYYAVGARDTVWALVAFSVMQYLVFFLSFRYGMGGLGRLDLICLAGAVLGIGLWIVTRNPVTALYCEIAVDAVGYVPTVRKAFAQPQTEDAFAWAVSLLAAAVNLLAVTSLTPRIALYPFVTLALDVVVTAPLVVYRIKRR